MKLIIDIPGDVYKDILRRSTEIQAEGYVIAGAVLNGTPLNTVKAEIRRMDYHMIDCDVLVSQDEVLEILDNIGKAESEDKECKSE